MDALATAAAALSESRDFRVLRRVPGVDRWNLRPVVGDTVRAVVLDCETTGLDDKDEVIELAIVPFEYERATGQVMSVGEPFHSFREPSVPIGDSVKIHGITSEMVAGRVITNEQVTRATFGAQVVIAHNAGFDRPMCERLWPVLEDIAWACSCNDIAWRAEGFETAALKWLLVSHGYFHDGHRAVDDALALLFLLTLPLADRLALSALLEQARKPVTIVQAIDTNFDNRGLLKGRGYTWEPGGNGRTKAWWLATTDPEAEVTWLKASDAWQLGTRVALRAVSPKVRYSRRQWE